MPIALAHGRFYEFGLKPGERRTYRDDKAEIVVMRLDHGGYSDITNLAFIVRANGYTIVHVGDAKLAHNENSLRTIDWSSYRVSLLFIEYFDQSTPTWDLIDSTIRPEHVVLMHIPPGEEDSVRNANAQIHPTSVVFGKENETTRFDRE